MLGHRVSVRINSPVVARCCSGGFKLFHQLLNGLYAERFFDMIIEVIQDGVVVCKLPSRDQNRYEVGIDGLQPPSDFAASSRSVRKVIWMPAASASSFHFGRVASETPWMILSRGRISES
jgi:hypothetical protein